MIELFQISNDPAFARLCDAIEGVRLFVDLERLGKAERQAVRDTFTSTHVPDDVGRIKTVLRKAHLMVRVNPLNSDTPAEVNAVLAQGAALLMLPMFTTAHELARFSAIAERVAQASRARGPLWGFGGIARLDEGMLARRDAVQVAADAQRIAATIDAIAARLAQPA